MLRFDSRFQDNYNTYFHSLCKYEIKNFVFKSKIYLYIIISVYLPIYYHIQLYYIVTWQTYCF